MAETIDHIFFDLDGTLIDSLPGIRTAIEAALAESGYQAELDDLRRQIGPAIRSMFGRIVPQAAEPDLARLEQSFRRVYDSVGWSRTSPYQGAFEALDRLTRAGKTLFLITNKPRHVTVKVLEMLGITGYFSGVITRDSQDPPFASKAAMLRQLMSRHATDAERSMVVGDGPEDYDAAAVCGVRAAIMLHGYGADRVAAGSVPCRWLNSFEELEAICLARGGEDD